MRVHKVLRVP